MKKLTTYEFIEKAKRVHRNIYDYSNTEYIGNNKNVIIVCKKHGKFLQTPHTHLHGCGCSICKGGVKSSLKEFIKKAKKINDYSFDYSKVIYKNSITKIEIICKKHKYSFFQTPGNHINLKQGCPICAKNIRLNTDEFISRSNKIHKNKYDYSKTIYGKNNIEKVIIICPIHGNFLQRPAEHLSGRGCPKCICRISKSEIEFLDYLKIPDTQNNRQVKILNKKVDGFDQNTNTIYEFLGNYYHGNPTIHKSYEYNQTCHKTFGKLYKETFEKFKKLKGLGYNIQYIWESDWKKFKKKETNNLSIISF